MTCITSGKCSDGVDLVSGNKITYHNHPPDMAKLHNEFYPIVAGGAKTSKIDMYN